MHIRLLGDRLLVHLEDPVRERNVDGVTLYYPEGSFGGEGELQVWARVEAVGSGVWVRKKGAQTGYRRLPEVEVGDRVRLVWLLSKVETNRHLQQYLGKNRLIVKMGDILCVEENTDKPEN